MSYGAENELIYGTNLMNLFIKLIWYTIFKLENNLWGEDLVNNHAMGYQGITAKFKFLFQNKIFSLCVVGM